MSDPKAHRASRAGEISDRDVSIVVQGPHHPGLTARCLEATRRVFPRAQIIFSTWPGDLPRLPVDEVVVSEDPGGARMHLAREAPTNFNRQLTSARAGVARVDRPFAIKMRSDCLLADAKFLRFAGRFGRRDERFAVFGERMLTYQYFTRRPGPGLFGVPHHPSDWFYFGRSGDVRDLMSTTPIDDEERFVNHHPPRAEDGMYPTWRMSPENYIWIDYLRRHGHAIEYSWDEWGPGRAPARSREYLRTSDAYLVNNFVVLGPAELALKSLKFGRFELTRDSLGLDTTVTHRDWLRLYNDHCGGSLAIPPWDGFRVKRKLVGVAKRARNLLRRNP